MSTFYKIINKFAWHLKYTSPGCFLNNKTCYKSSSGLLCVIVSKQAQHVFAHTIPFGMEASSIEIWVWPMPCHVTGAKFGAGSQSCPFPRDRPPCDWIALTQLLSGPYTYPQDLPVTPGLPDPSNYLIM